MKFTLIPVLLCSLFFAYAQSPISLTSADMPPVGFTEVFAVDTPLTSVNYGSPGANQVYDFSSLTNTHTVGITYVAASTVPQHTSFPTANQALLSNGNYVYLDSTAAKLTAVGIQGLAYGLLTLTPLSPPEVLYEFPTQYQSTFSSSYGFYQGFTGSQVNAPNGVDSVREIYTDNFTSLVDGWGKIITPVGSYRGLRIQTNHTITIEVDAYYGLFGDSWHNVASATYNDVEYSYVSKETKGAVVSFAYNDTTNAIRDAEYSLIRPAPPVAGFGYVTGPTGLVTFTDTSEGYPTQYHWNFGDGDTSNLANPTHTYATNGTYYVCETVYNPSGSNTICDSVHITNIVIHLPPVAANDAATVVQPSNDTINVTANDHSPSNDAFCITAIYGGSYFTTSGCDNVAFNPPSNFSGYDTCYYIVCNTGQPTLCDTAEVIVDVVLGHLPPVTVNDNVTDGENQTDTINVTSNDHSPSGDAFCVTNVYGPDLSLFTVDGCNNLIFMPTTNFIGYDTVYYVACNTNQPTLCDTSRVIVDVTGTTHLPPVTVNDNVTDPENTTDVINVTANDHSPSGDAFCVTAIYGPNVSLFTVSGCNNLIFAPATNFTGYDTVYYIACNTGQPNLCDTSSVIVDVIGQELAPVAVNDTLTTLQPAFGAINVTANDYSPTGDSFCITTVYPATVFSIADCHNLVFSPSATFTGNDTVWYVVCNVNQPTLCDTANVVVTVTPNPALLPVVDFSVSTPLCNGIIVNSEASNANNISWNFNDGTNSVYPQVNSVHYDAAGTVLRVQVCLTASNTYGTNTKCDTVNAVCDAGINEVQLSAIRMYPNPASRQLTIDMRDNPNAVTKYYQAIEIYNAIGQKVLYMTENNRAEVVNVPVNQLAQGIYLATIIDGRGARSVLGKFTVIQ